MIHIGGSFWAIGDERLFHRKFFHGSTVVNGRRVQIGYDRFKKKKKVK